MKIKYTHLDHILKKTQQEIAASDPENRSPKKEDVALVVKAFLKTVAENVAYSPLPVMLPGICRIQVKVRKPTRRMNLKTKQVEETPAQEVVFFVPAEELKSMVRLARRGF